MDSVLGINTQFLKVSSKNHHCPRISKTISFSSIKSSSSSSSSVQFLQNPNTKPPIKTLSSVAITAASLFLNRCTQSSISASVEENEDNLRAIFSRFDEEALKSLLNVKIRHGKINEAISICERLMVLEPTEVEWVLKFSHLLARTKDYEMALIGFEAVISEDPLNIDAYYGLILCINDSGLGEYENALIKIEKAMNICKQENKKLRLREFKLFVAQIMVLQRNYTAALKIYEELVDENILDYRPYLCQGIVYTLLKKPDEAKKSFDDDYGILGPKGHP